MHSSIHRHVRPTVALLCSALSAVCVAQAPAGQPPQPASPRNVAAPAADGQTEQAALEAADHALQWPRTLNASDGMQVQLYQPQIDSWNGDQIGGRMAVAVGKADGTPTYGVVQFAARADVNKVLAAEPLLRNTAEAYAPKPDYRPLTKFENRGIKLGHGVWDLVFERKA